MDGLRARGDSHTMTTMFSGHPVGRAVNCGKPCFLPVSLYAWLISEFSLKNTPFLGKVLLAVCVNAVGPSCHDTVGRRGVSPIGLCHHRFMTRLCVGNNPAREGPAIIVPEESLSESSLSLFLLILFFCCDPPLECGCSKLPAHFNLILWATFFITCQTQICRGTCSNT